MLQPDAEFAVPPVIPLATAATAVEEIAAQEGLRVVLRGTLAQYPGCTHWQLKRGKEGGTLEVILLQRRDGGRILLAAHANRRAPWISEAIDRFVAALAARL